jgi:protein farnesyltransferase/geranylgeranyltransferase type-1 subunit alpha
MQKDSYAENPEWADVQPIPQDDGVNPLVPIAYSRECMIPSCTTFSFRSCVLCLLHSITPKPLDSDAMDYFRAVARTNEKSQRVFELTAHIIDMNPAHYTIWYGISNSQLCACT